MSAGSGSGLSAEQLRRMEENRHRARQKLASRKSRPEVGSWGITAPPSSARGPQLGANPVHSAQSKADGSSLYGHARIMNPFPVTSTPSGGVPPNTLPVKPVPKTQSVAVPSKPSQPVSGHTATNIKFSALKRTIKANLLLTSKQRFEVVMPYDVSAIDIFKRMPSSFYNAKTATWSFGIGAYNKLVETLQKECKHIELSQIPKPVINLFLSQLPTQSSRPQSSAEATPTSGSTCWNGVEPRLASTLMQFQREGVDYCIRCGGRALLADDMGLGKTLQALAVMCHYRGNWPLLVICPSSVKLTWAEAFRYWVPSLEEEDVSVVLTSRLPQATQPVTIISYDLATRLSKQLAERRPDAIIVDESHFLKNFKTHRCKAILPLIRSATRCLLLSGTPALSRPIELYTQISALDRTFKMSQMTFAIRYCNAVKNHFGWDLSGASNLTELHLYMHQKFMIRRTKSEVLDQLPSKRRQMVQLDPSMTKSRTREVREMRQELDKASTLKAIDRRSALLPLFEKTGRLKLPAVRDYILDLLEGGRKLIVFGHHRSVLDSICECLEGKKYEYIRIDGRTPVESRQLYCDRFQHDEKCLVAVLSITTANAGLTLTASSTVVFAELFWNPGILVQAEDRVYRIGQKNSVNVHYLVARETVDDFIWPLIQSKLDVLNQAGLAGDDFSSADSTILKGFKSQETLFEFFGDMCTDREFGEEESEVDSSEGGRKRTGRGEEEEVRKKRRRGGEPLPVEDPDFVVKAQKLKLSHKRDCPRVKAMSPKKQAKQRTLTSMCCEPSVEGKGKGRLGEGVEQSKNNRSTALASYVLSQHSRRSSDDTAQEPHTCSAVEGPSACLSGKEESEVEPMVLTAQSSTAGGGDEGDEDMEWFKDLDDSDFVSFDDFKDDDVV